MKKCCRSDISPVDPGYQGFLCCMMPAASHHHPTRATYQLEDSASLERVLSSLESLRTKPDGEDSDIEFLRSILQSSDFQSLVKVHQKVKTPEAKDQSAMTNHALDLAKEVVEELELRSQMPEAAELTGILAKMHIHGLFLAHDQIAAREYMPHLPEIPYEVDEDEESIKIVRLVKGNNEPLGATIKLDEKKGTIYIARILHGGAADRSGLIHVGDEVQEVNGVSVNGKEPNEVVRILTETAGPITLKLVPGEDADYCHNRESKMRVRAHFSYEPGDDKHIPCKEAGLAFQRGDILHIVSQDDSSWWQARREGDRNMRAGLIPSRQLQERKMALQNGEKIESSPKSSPKHKAHKSPIKSPKFTKKSKKAKKIMYYSIQNEDYDAEELVTYEEVEKYYPRLGRYRPIVLLGSPGVGRNELKRRLLATNSNHFKSTIPHTSRPQKPDELDGEEYFFLSRNEMDKEIQNRKFVEFGEYKGNLYGTSIDAIKSVVNSGHVAVLCPHPQALKLLRNGELKPYVIFVKPPSLEVLKETRTAMNAKSTFDEKSSRPFTDEEFQEMINGAARLEVVYGHCFDQTIVNDDLNKAVNELTLAAHRIETEPQWVPAAWMG